MNILFRHTFSGIARDPVQSLIVVISTAMMTACVLLCLTISSMFEQTTALWGMNSTGGSDVTVIDQTGNFDPHILDGLAEEFSEDIEYVYASGGGLLTVETPTGNIRAKLITSEDIDIFNKATGARIIAETDEDPGLTPAYVSETFADVADMWTGDTFRTDDGNEFYVKAVCANTTRYFDQLTAVFACERDTSHSLYVYFRDAYALKDGERTDKLFAEKAQDIVNGAATVAVNGTFYEELMADSVEGSMRLMTVAAVIIVAVMACLLYSSFSVIVRGRVNELVKFKAAGATPLQATLILLVEAALYAVAGGLIGLGIGEGLIQYLNSLLSEIVTGAAIVAPAYKYVLALVIGAACGLAACVLPSARMCSKSIRSLLGGDERMTKRFPVPLAIALTAVMIALSISVFFVPQDAMPATGIVTVAAVFLWIVFAMPRFLQLVCAILRKTIPSGVSHVAECAAPRNAAVNASLSMLAALIAFITLGTSIIEVVNYSSVPSSARVNADLIAALDDIVTDPDPLAHAESELERLTAIDGVTDGAPVLKAAGAFYAARPGETDDDNLGGSIYGFTDGRSLKYCYPSLSAGAEELFDSVEHPVVLTAKTAKKAELSVGDTVIIRDNGWSIPVEFTVVGIDETYTSYDDLLGIRAEDLTKFVWVSTAEILLDGDASRIAEIRELANVGSTHIYSRSGFYSAEGRDKLDSDAVIGMFTFMIYGIAALGLVNLILMTAGGRKKEFDVLRLAGMTPAGALGYILTETATLSACGFSAGLLLAFVANRASEGICILIGNYVTIESFPPRMLFISLAATGIFALLWTVSHMIAFLRVSSSRYRKRDDRGLRSD